jgi:hypothetical protein
MGLFSRFKKGKGADSDEGRAERDDQADGDADEGDEHLYQQVPLSVASLTTDSQLVYARHEVAQVMPNFTAEILRRCVEFETLEDHAVELVQELRLSGDQIKGVKEQLDELVAQGLLVEHDDLAERIRKNAPESPAGTFSTLGIVTSDRPEALRRCLDSYLDAMGDRSIDIVVVDDSNDESNRAANREAVAAASARAKGVLRYAGPEQRSAFAAVIADELGHDGEIVELALLGGHGIGNVAGGATNALLLSAAGGRIFISDDDVVCKVAPVPDSEPGLAFSSTPDPTSIVVYPDRDSARDSVELVARDVLAEHERVVGRSAATLVADAELDDLDLTGAGPRFLDRTGRGVGTVRISTTGVAGDSGMGGPLSFLRMSGRGAAEDVQQDNDTYRSAVEARSLVRGALTTTISSGSLLITMAAGYDATSMLPPFSPVLRNQDVLYAHTLAACEPGASIAHLPWVIEHDPPDDRHHDADEAWQSFGEVRVNDLIGVFVRSVMLEAEYGEPANRMATVGRHLRWLGSLKGAELLETVRRYLWAQTGAEMSMFEHRLINEELPPLLAGHLERAIERGAEVVERPDFGAPVDLTGEHSPEEAVSIFGALLEGYGRMLELWPEVWAAAVAVRERGVSLGEPVPG